MDEDVYRRLTAQVAAHAALINTLLRFQMKDLNAEQARVLGDLLKQQYADSTPYVNATIGDEEASERLADMVVLMQKHAHAIVDDAVKAIERREGN